VLKTLHEDKAVNNLFAQTADGKLWVRARLCQLADAQQQTPLPGDPTLDVTEIKKVPTVPTIWPGY
jgi:hypothetical protein